MACNLERLAKAVRDLRTCAVELIDDSNDDMARRLAVAIVGVEGVYTILKKAELDKKKE